MNPSSPFHVNSLFTEFTFESEHAANIMRVAIASAYGSIALAILSCIAKNPSTISLHIAFANRIFFVALSCFIVGVIMELYAEVQRYRQIQALLVQELQGCLLE